mgnify:CR=1 FL=1
MLVCEVCEDVGELVVVASVCFDAGDVSPVGPVVELFRCNGVAIALQFDKDAVLCFPFGCCWGLGVGELVGEFFGNGGQVGVCEV